ncbi:D-alanine--D-alanine ligase [Bacteroidota bacterium]
MVIKNIGILYETLEDAQKIKNKPLEYLDHWREQSEIEAIRNAIEKLGFNTILLGTPKKFAKNNKINPDIDFIFSLSCGYVSRFRQAAGAMVSYLLQLPYTGADPYAKILGQNKHLTKSLFDHIGIPTPKWNYIHSLKHLSDINFPPFPLIVKPACEGTSVGIFEESVVSKKEDLIKQIEFIINDINLSVIVEQFIIGEEIKVGFIGNHERLFEGMFEDVHEDGSSLMSDFLHYNAKKKRNFTKLKLDYYDSSFAKLRDYCILIYELFCPVDYGVFDIRRYKEAVKDN